MMRVKSGFIGSIRLDIRRRKPQVNMYLQRQLTKLDWATITDKTKPFGERCVTLCKRQESLGCVNGTEYTEVHMEAL